MWEKFSLQADCLLSHADNHEYVNLLTANQTPRCFNKFIY